MRRLIVSFSFALALTATGSAQAPGPDLAKPSADARHFVIQPASHWWDQNSYRKSAGAKPVAEDFQYSSDRNADWLSRPQLAEILKHEAIEL